MNDFSPESIYTARIKDCERGLAGLRRIETSLGVLKLFIVAAGLFALFKAGTAYSSRWLVMLVGAIILFASAAIIHEMFIRKSRALQLLKDINTDEIRSLKHEFLGVDAGAGFEDSDHPYAPDIDLFGGRSVFHYINRAATSAGVETLAGWLKSAPRPQDVREIGDRQAAVAEIKGKLDLRQNVQLHGRLIEDSPAKRDGLKGLLAEPPALLPKRALVTVIHLLPLITIGAISLAIAGLPWLIVPAPVLLQILLNRRMRDKVARVYGMTSRTAEILTAYSRIIRELEGAEFESPLLKRIREGLRDEYRPASLSIRKLASLAGYFDMRTSEFFHALFNTLLLWDLHCLYRIERWIQAAAGRVPGWFEAMGSFEALSSLACLGFNHPDWAVPRISETGAFLEAVSLGHFLIPDAERVSNDLRIGGPGSILIITGPNMAGKSTFLKTVGVNMVLALAGGPVCARSFAIRPVRLYSSMKVSDSLDKSLSLFYAELQRLKMVLDAVDREERVFFLLDEILKGTNALDRQKGAIALLRQLAGKSSGIVATHDLELTKLEQEFPDRIINHHFDGYIEGDKLLFDYRLKKGKCESFNALILMRKIGIDI